MQPQTTQHYEAMNSFFTAPPPVSDIEQLEAQAKIQDMGQNVNTPAKQKLDVLEEILWAIEGTGVYGNIDATQLCLVLDLINPINFKVSKFDKYDWSSYLRSHLIMYYRKIEAHISNDKLLIHWFQNNLTGLATWWYIDMALDCLDL